MASPSFAPTLHMGREPKSCFGGADQKNRREVRKGHRGRKVEQRPLFLACFTFASFANFAFIALILSLLD